MYHVRYTLTYLAPCHIRRGNEPLFFHVSVSVCVMRQLVCLVMCVIQYGTPHRKGNDNFVCRLSVFREWPRLSVKV